MTAEHRIDFRALDSFSDYCILVSERGIILDMNTSFATAMNRTKKSLIKIPLFEMLDTPSILEVENALIQCLESGTTNELEGKIITGEGISIDINLFFSSCSKHPKTNERQILIIARNITEEKKKEIDLLRFYNVAQNTVNPLQITDLNGRMVYVNPAFVKSSGYSKEELIGNFPSIFSSYKYSKKFWEGMWNTISSGEVWVGEVENKKKSGEPFFTQLLVSPILNNENKVMGYFGIHRDLTDKRNLEKQLIHTQKMESIGTLAAGVAHEVGNPLASISALVQIIQRSTKDDFIKEKLELVKKQVTRISKIIRDLVDFSRPSNYELRLTDINENIRESIEIVRVGKKAKDIEFNSKLDTSISPLPLVADQMQQVFVNILINAVDAMTEKVFNPEDNLPKVINVFTELHDDHVLITFEDNGAGISEENIVKIFEPFFTTKQEGKGTGLGLWVSYGIIKSFQGDIRVESKKNHWTKFIIQLPLNN